ncbi:TetR/AcrR family transcriptional regulator [Mycobacterium malmoense]|uniref:TetR/AcrR family transcriptional regulator n=1 Tax=Mycobacterium malmoense TaxID=1780 RepID=UPI0009F9C534|nr:TetR/AcrR family transcriptional regulator [Mycobacterium malmoense]
MARTVNVAEHAARRDEILDAAQRLILSAGYERLTVQDILNDLQISKGAFYHYFDSKPTVIEALTTRLVGDSERALAPIVENPGMGALDKLQAFFGEIIRWKSERQNLFVTMLPVWYAPDNRAFRLLVDRESAKRLAPLLSAIVRQGVDEGRFATAYPDHAGAIIFAIIQALQDEMAHRLLAAPHQSIQAPNVREMVKTHGAHMEAIERYLGVPAGTLNRVDARTVKSWIAASHRSSPAADGRR